MIWKDVWLEGLDKSRMEDLESPDGGSGREFGWKFRTAPGWGNQKGFWLENMKVRRLGDRMEMWLGGPKEDVIWSNG